MTDVLTTWVIVIFRVKMSCITKVDSIKLWLLIWLVNLVVVIGRLSVKPSCYCNWFIFLKIIKFCFGYIWKRTSYWGKFGPLDPLDPSSVGIIVWLVDEVEIFRPRDWRLYCLSVHGGWDRWMTFQTPWWVGLTYFLSQFTYKISDTIELKSSIFSLVIVFRAGWSFPSTTGSAKEWKR